MLIPKKILGSLLFLFALFFITSIVVYAKGAEDILNYDSSIGAQTDVNLPKIKKDRPEEKVGHIIYTAIEIMLSIAGVIAVVIMVIAGTQYTISTGDDDMISSAKKKIIWALSGLMVIIFSYAILTNVEDFLSKPKDSAGGVIEGSGAGAVYTQEELEYITRWESKHRTLSSDERAFLIEKKRAWDNNHPDNVQENRRRRAKNENK